MKKQEQEYANAIYEISDCFEEVEKHLLANGYANEYKMLKEVHKKIHFRFVNRLKSID